MTQCVNSVSLQPDAEHSKPRVHYVYNISAQENRKPSRFLKLNNNHNKHGMHFLSKELQTRTLYADKYNNR